MTGHCPSKIHEKENDLLENVWFQRTFNSLTPTKTSTQVWNLSKINNSSGVFIVNFEESLHIALVFSLLTSNK